MKSSKPSSESSRTSPNGLWPVGTDSYTTAQLLLALEGSEWTVHEPLPCVQRVLDALSRAPSSAVIFIPAADFLTASMGSLPPGIPIIVHGDASALSWLTRTSFDDYLADPWTGDELLYRLRRVTGARVLRCRDGVLSWGRLWVAAISHGGIRSTAPVTPVQFDLFDVLARSAGASVVRESLQAHVASFHESSRALDMHVSRLRTIIGELTADWPHAPRIRAHRGVGYCLETG